MLSHDGSSSSGSGSSSSSGGGGGGGSPSSSLSSDVLSHDGTASSNHLYCLKPLLFTRSMGVTIDEKVS